MALEKLPINDVSDTALWVAHYRAVESEKPDALFRDPFAHLLVGDRGRAIARNMKGLSRFTEWTLIIRTCLIDDYIRELVNDGVDTVLNLGAGLDTRPYRLALPKSLNWIEVDYPHMIEHKTSLLAKEKPLVALERVPLDLADQEKRKALFARIGSYSKKTLILTEGVIPYLTEDQVGSLAQDLLSEKSFCFWIAEYLSPHVYRFFKKRFRQKQMKNAPFQFFPAEWLGFFENHGWVAREVRYLAEESKKRNRKMPYPWWTYPLRPFISRKTVAEWERRSGYVLFTRKDSVKS